MPKDLWAKARAKDAAKRGRRDKKKWRTAPGSSKSTKGLPFILREGTAVFVRRDGGEWREHRMKMTLLFRVPWHGDAKWFYFQSGGWEIRAIRSFVDRATN